MGLDDAPGVMRHGRKQGRLGWFGARVLQMTILLADNFQEECRQTQENLEKTMLEKRFTPSWLAGTSIGELMFQADYYLKELSMGESLCGI